MKLPQRAKEKNIWPYNLQNFNKKNQVANKRWDITMVAMLTSVSPVFQLRGRLVGHGIRQERKVDQVGRPTVELAWTGPKWPMRGRDFYEIWEIAVMTEMFASQNHQLIFDLKKLWKSQLDGSQFEVTFPPLIWGGANLSSFKCRQNSKVIPTVDLTNLGSANFLMCWISNSWDGLRNTSRTQQVRWKWHCQPCRIKIIKENLRLRRILLRKKRPLILFGICIIVSPFLCRTNHRTTGQKYYILAAYYYILHTIS